MAAFHHYNNKESPGFPKQNWMGVVVWRSSISELWPAAVSKAGTCFPGMNLNLLDLFRLAVVAFLCRPTTCSLTRTWYLQQRLIPFINVFLNPPFSSLAESAAASLGVLHLLLNPFQHFLHLPQLHIGKKWKDNLDKSDKSRWGRQ